MPTATAMSSRPAARASWILSRASMVMNSVAPSRRLSAFSDSESSPGSDSDSCAPRKVCAGGRGLSVGNSSTGGQPSNCARQYASSSLSDPPSICPRCQLA
jgi:hypothetical protein